MPAPIEDAVNEMFESRGMTVEAGELKGAVKVLDKDSLMDLVRSLVAGAESEAKLAAASGSGISKMLDDYMRQNADLRQKENSARRRAQEAEIQLKLTEAKLKEAGAGAGGGAGFDPAVVEPYFLFDPSGGTALLDEIDAAIATLESALNDIEDAEGSWAFVSRVAEMRTDFNTLRDEFQKAVASYQSSADAFKAGGASAARALEVVDASCAARGKVSEARLMKKSVEFFKSVIQSE